MKRFSATRAILAVATALTAGSAARADVAGPSFAIRVGGIAGEPMLIDGHIGWTSNYNPNPGTANLGFNTDTGTLYARENQSGTETFRFDPSYEFEKGQPFVEAGKGTMRDYTNGYHFAGAVSGGVDLGNSKSSFGWKYDPYMTTNGYSGVIVAGQSGNTPHYQEYVTQTAGQALGQVNEGSVASPHNTGARVTVVTLTSTSIAGLGDAGHWYELAPDAPRGQFIPTNDAATADIASNSGGDGTVGRYFMGISTTTPSGSGNWFTSVYAVHADATRSVEPTTTTVGAREFYFRDNSAAQALVISGTDFENLVPSIADVGKDMAVDPVNGDLYFLSIASNTAYLTAIRPSISDDSDVAITYEVVDLDLTDNGGLPGGNVYRALTDFHGDLVGGVGLTFNGDGSRLYIAVSANASASGEVTAVYALDVTHAAVPEPTTSALLLLGTVMMAGAGLRRRRAAAA
ncbi:MAG: hypothetical protein BIFFINMI_03177 [Phycisphaerae bacterium]|nr:hypothetical protein [Phycisphaerae bacterium]